jgi:hypothetical protein
MKFNLDKFKKRKTNTYGLDKAILVFISDGFGLLGAIIEDKGSDVAVVASARSHLTDPLASLIEVSGKLSFCFGKLPKEAILIHANAIPSILELPIENVESIEKSKLQELVRWEMESVFSDLVPHDNLGWLMIGLGFISEQQRDSLVSELINENTESNKKIRIGELAIRESYITRNQLEECLKIQDQMQLQDQRIKCGWNEIKDSNPPRWLATAMSKGIHEQWITAFESTQARIAMGKVRLNALYPFIGVTASQLIDIFTDNEAYILELHNAYISLMTYRDGRLLQCLVHECSGDIPKINDVESLIHSADIADGSEINLLMTHANRNDLRELLSTHSTFKFTYLERKVSISNQISGDVSISEAMMIYGATFNYVSGSHQLIVPVQGQEPPPPIYKMPEFKIVASVLVFILLIGGIESILAWKTNKLDVKLNAVEEKVERQELVKKDIRASKKAQQRLDEVNGEYNDLIALKGLMESVLVTRQDFTSEFLNIITRNLNDNLVINSIEELEWNKFVIDGWALDQPSIDYYGQGLSRDLKKWDMIIAENPSNLGRNQAGLTGYKFKFVLQKIPARLVSPARNSSITQRNIK